MKQIKVLMIGQGFMGGIAHPRGILEAIFWEPQMHYLIDAIRIIKRGRWLSFRRNEVINVISLDSAISQETRL